MHRVALPWRCAVFLCTNERPPGASRASCGGQRGRELRRSLRDATTHEGLRDAVLVTTSRCLGVCSPLGHTALLVDGDGVRELAVITGESDHEALLQRIRDLAQG